MKTISLLLTGLLIAVSPGPALAYIGPGAGFAVAGSLLIMFLSLLSATLLLLTWPVRFLLRAFRQWHTFQRCRIKKCVILGLDGLDPTLTEKYLAEGKLPHLAQLREQGCFQHLTTTIPPISPVAWSSFQTGSNPGKHSIYDFLTRDPRTYRPRLSSVEIRSPLRKISWGKYQIPLAGANIRQLRKGIPFWKILGKHGIFSSVIRVPVTFPPESFRGVQLSGLCVPDLRGTQGTFSYYSTREDSKKDYTGGDFNLVTKNQNSIKCTLIGPENPYRKDRQVLTCPFAVKIKDETSAEIKISGQNYKLMKNTYTNWIKVEFKIGWELKIRGICRFLLLSTTPDFSLYVTPINIDPEKPAMPLSHPAVFSSYLARRQGSFATLVLAEDTWALNEKLLDEEQFLQQCLQIDEEREKMFFDSLDKIKRGLCVCVFEGTDRIQHTFWREPDEKHSTPQSPSQGSSVNAIEEIYQRADRLVGKVMQKCRDPRTLLMIISDHGFSSFRYGVDLNRWLEENGYLSVKPELRDHKHLESIDWSQTQAYALGLSGMFLNVKGREAQGIVEPGPEAQKLGKEISEKLSELIEPARGKKVVKKVYHSQDIYQGPYKNEAPDLIVGYHRSYRASWETAVGRVTNKVIHENTRAWSGDHCIDHTLVPGVFFCNRPVITKNPRLIDIAPTVLDMFGIPVPVHIDGKPLFENEEETNRANRKQAN